MNAPLLRVFEMIGKEKIDKIHKTKQDKTRWHIIAYQGDKKIINWVLIILNIKVD